MADIIIVGGGPAGVSAALTARNRGKEVLVISNSYEESDIYKAKLVTNYPGMPQVTGPELMEVFHKQLSDSGAELITARALNAMAMGKEIYVSTGQDNYSCRALILAMGTAKRRVFKGEAEFLGRGVSYCATCDGMLYRGKKVAVVGMNAYAAHEAEFLRSIGCQVEYFDKSRAVNYEIKGTDMARVLVADGQEYPVDGIFILRSTIAPEGFMSGLELSQGHIAVNERMETSLEGVFAAGDCIGRPYQVARAVGQGNTAAIFAAEYLDKNR